MYSTCTIGSMYDLPQSKYNLIPPLSDVFLSWGLSWNLGVMHLTVIL